MPEPEGDRAALTLARETVRKLLHLVTAAIPVFYSRTLSREAVLALLAAATGIAVIVEVARRHSWAFRSGFERAFGTLLRRREESSLTGATWLLAACLATVLLLPRSAAVATLWCATAGDPAATLAGGAFAAWRGGRIAKGKTSVGSAACFGTSLIGVSGIAHFPVAAAATIALTATIFERASLPFDDNVRIAVTAGTAAWLLS